MARRRMNPHGSLVGLTDEALSAIQKAHKIPDSLPNFDIVPSDASGFAMFSGSSGRGTEVRLRSGGGIDELVHELGHSIQSSYDWGVVSTKERKAIASMGKATPSYKKGVTNKYDRQTDEVWARAYEQFVATRSGQLEHFRSQPGWDEGKHWSEADFEPIGQAMDKLFADKGLAPDQGGSGVARKLTKAQRGVNGVTVKSPKRGGSRKPYGKFSPVTKRQERSQDLAVGPKPDGLVLPSNLTPEAKAQLVMSQPLTGGYQGPAGSTPGNPKLAGTEHQAGIGPGNKAGKQRNRNSKTPGIGPITNKEIRAGQKAYEAKENGLRPGEPDMRETGMEDPDYRKLSEAQLRAMVNQNDDPEAAYELEQRDMDPYDRGSLPAAGEAGGFPKKVGRADPNSDSFSDAGPIYGDKETVAAVLHARVQMLKNAEGSGSDVSQGMKQVHELEMEHGVKAGIPGLDDPPNYEAMSPKQLLQVPANDGIHIVHPDAYAELEARAADGDKAAQAVHPEYTGKKLSTPKTHKAGSKLVGRSGKVGLMGQKGVRTSKKSGLPTHGPKLKGARNSIVNGNWKRQARDPRTGKWI